MRTASAMWVGMMTLVTCLALSAEEGPAPAAGVEAAGEEEAVEAGPAADRLSARREALEFSVACRQWRGKFRLLERDFARTSSDAERTEMIDSLYEIEDPAGLAELTSLLASKQIELRRAAVTILGMKDVTSDDLPAALVDVVLNDPSDDIRTIAASALERVHTGVEIRKLLRALERNNRYQAGWAAIALGQLRDFRAVKPLIDELVVYVTVPVETLQTGAGKDYIAGWECKVARGAVGYQPIIKKLGGGVRVRGTRRAPTGNRDALDALVKITGRDFGYDQNAWRAWYKEEGKALLDEQTRQRRAAEAPRRPSAEPVPASQPSESRD